MDSDVSKLLEEQLNGLANSYTYTAAGKGGVGAKPSERERGGDRVVGKIMVNEKKESCGCLKMKEFPKSAKSASHRKSVIVTLIFFEPSRCSFQEKKVL